VHGLASLTTHDSPENRSLLRLAVKGFKLFRLVNGRSFV